ncbi:hypothetical protein SDC9_67133 [bioreactor metagenome]|uniref:Uncharacterized protein n=1 Tax=bioreactor metagenome TaxID=1076179 RepID=A0A644XXT1_9ZZZZ
MKEFGSDFHYIEAVRNNPTLFDLYPKSNLYANGRQAIQALISHEGWKRIWMPDYFCYEIINAIKKIDIQICFYHDNPLSNDQKEIEKLSFEEGDVLFRVNYFGIRALRSIIGLSIPVIEDHSHDLVGDWPIHSYADWCIASLRKTLPVPEGGILWSPKNHQLPELPKQSNRNILLVKKRWEAMRLKKDYIENKIFNKNGFRKLFLETESDFEKLSIAPITEDCKTFLSNFDIKDWFQQKQYNWHILSDIQSDKIELLKRETGTCNNFSFIMLFQTVAVRDEVRYKLIDNSIYPAILWKIPEDKPDAKDISDKMLSIACDGRYTTKDIVVLKSQLENILKHV